MEYIPYMAALVGVLWLTLVCRKTRISEEQLIEGRAHQYLWNSFKHNQYGLRIFHKLDMIERKNLPGGDMSFLYFLPGNNAEQVTKYLVTYRAAKDTFFVEATEEVVLMSYGS
jgi:hypothetical protein